MRIDSKNNIVVPVETGDEKEPVTVYFHSEPILLETFQRYHFVMASAFTKLMQGNLALTGAKIAAMTLQEVAEEMGKWEDEPKHKYIGVKSGLMEEIERLTNTVVFDGCWKVLPVNTALQRELIEEEEWREAKQRIVFFTLVCAMMGKAEKADMLNMTNDIWGTLITSFNSTEYANSLPMLTETGSLPKAEQPLLAAT